MGGIPNRWLSVSCRVGRSSSSSGGDPWITGLPPPRAQENVAEHAQPTCPPATAGMGRSTEADGERERARSAPPNSLHRWLDKACFIDGGLNIGRRCTPRDNPSPALRRAVPNAPRRWARYWASPGTSEYSCAAKNGAPRYQLSGSRRGRAGRAPPASALSIPHSSFDTRQRCHRHRWPYGSTNAR